MADKPVTSGDKVGVKALGSEDSPNPTFIASGDEIGREDGRAFSEFSGSDVPTGHHRYAQINRDRKLEVYDTDDNGGEIKGSRHPASNKEAQDYQEANQEWLDDPSHKNDPDRAAMEELNDAAAKTANGGKPDRRNGVNDEIGDHLGPGWSQAQAAAPTNGQGWSQAQAAPRADARGWAQAPT